MSLVGVKRPVGVVALSPATLGRGWWPGPFPSTVLGEGGGGGVTGCCLGGGGLGLRSSTKLPIPSAYMARTWPGRWQQRQVRVVHPAMGAARGQPSLPVRREHIQLTHV